jgi:hypothetical protein
VQKQPSKVSEQTRQIESDASVQQKPLTFAENAILTIKVLVVAGLIFAALWAFISYAG